MSTATACKWIVIFGVLLTLMAWAIITAPVENVSKHYYDQTVTQSLRSQ